VPGSLFHIVTPREVDTTAPVSSRHSNASACWSGSLPTTFTAEYSGNSSACAW
jgi:hypothetical protein